MITLPTANWQSIRHHPAFTGIDDARVRSMLPYFTELSLDSNQFLVEEDEASSIDLYLILEGELAVIKRHKETTDEPAPWIARREFTIASLHSGDAIGELSFVKGGPRSATIRSKGKSRLLSISPDAVTSLEKEQPESCCRLMKNMLGYVGERLKQTSENEVKALKVELQHSNLNSKANIFFSYVIGLLCFYNLAIHRITTLSMDASRASIISAVIIVVFAAGLAQMINHNKLPIQLFGLTTRKWKTAVRESMMWTVGIIAVLVLIKFVLIKTVTRYQDMPLVHFDVGNQKYLAFNFALYGLHSPIQEFIARGVLQGSLTHFFKGRNITIRAIVISNALFSATHVHLLGGLLGAIVFVPGLFWGWMYARHGNLIGVSISHILVGWTGLFFLDLESLF